MKSIITTCLLVALCGCSENKNQRPKEKLLPYSEVSKISGTGHMMNTGSYCAKIYNGSDWHLTRVVISLKYVEENGAVKWQRDYSIYPTGYIRPLTTETDFVTVGEYVSSSQKEEPLNIKEVYGVKR